MDEGKRKNEKGKATKQKLKPVVAVSVGFTFWVVVLPFAIYLLIFPEITHACPFCKEILFDPAQMASRLATAKAYALSIGLMLVVPATLIGAITFVIARAIRRKKHSLSA